MGGAKVFLEAVATDEARAGRSYRLVLAHGGGQRDVLAAARAGQHEGLAVGRSDQGRDERAQRGAGAPSETAGGLQGDRCRPSHDRAGGKERADSLCRIDQPADTEEEEERRPRQSSRNMSNFTGKPITPTEDQLFFLDHPPKPRRFQDLEAFQEAADGIEERNTELMASLQRAWLQASDQRIALIELDRDAAIKALDEQELSEEQHAQAVSTDPADRQSWTSPPRPDGWPRPRTRRASRRSSCPIPSRGSARSPPRRSRTRSSRARSSPTC